jgi:hypothetical protein
MKNVVFWDIETQFVLHRGHITSPLQSPASQCCRRLEVFTAEAKKNAVFWDVAACGTCYNRRLGGTCRLSEWKVSANQGTTLATSGQKCKAKWLLEPTFVRNVSPPS